MRLYPYKGEGKGRAHGQGFPYKGEGKGRHHSSRPGTCLMAPMESAMRWRRYERRRMNSIGEMRYALPVNR